MREFLQRLFPREKIDYDGFLVLLSLCVLGVVGQFVISFLDDEEFVRIEKIVSPDSLAEQRQQEEMERQWAAADSVNVNTSSTYSLRRIGFSWYEISMLLTFREAGYVFDSLADLHYINHIDSAHLAKVGSKIVFDHDPARPNISHRNDWKRKTHSRPHHIPRTPLFLADSATMRGQGMSAESWTVLKAYQEGYVLKGSIRQDSLTQATPDELASMLKNHVAGVRRSRAKGSGGKTSPSSVSQTQPRVETAVVVELNSATLEQLVGLPYVKEKTAKAIMDYRDRLGGFVAVEQLREVWAVGERFDKIAPHVRVDSTAVRKINVNSKNDTEMRRHPYFSKRIAYLIRRTAKGRGKRGPALDRQDMESIVRGERLSPWFWSYVGYGAED